MNQCSRTGVAGPISDLLLGEPREIRSELGSMTVQALIDGSLWVTNIAAHTPYEVDSLELIQSLAQAAAREFKRVPIAA
jgi:hypothetical protein